MSFLRQPYSQNALTFSSTQLRTAPAARSYMTWTYCRKKRGQTALTRSHEELREVQRIIAWREERLAGMVRHEQYEDAAKERDRLHLDQLTRRRLELEEQSTSRSKLIHRVGSVVFHRRYQYRGVVIGYDHSCQAPESWIRAMKVDGLPLGREQPFYHVLVDERDRPGAQSTYVAQENLTTLRGGLQPVEHPLVPQLFTQFDSDSGCYLPRPQLRAQYPDDG